MRVYDFDNTIYDGESVFDFFLFCIRKKPSYLKYLPLMLRKLIRYKRCKTSIRELTESAERVAYEMLQKAERLEDWVVEFWDQNEHKIKPFYCAQQREDDLIITASLGFLIREIFRRIGIRHYICTEINPKTGKLEFLCYHENKAKEFRERYGDTRIEEFYTDSLNDQPMINLSENAFLVKGDRIERIKP